MATDGGKLQRVESFQWPAGHVGHLTDNQRNALDQFKELCEQKGYYTPANIDAKTPPSHDEETLLRYLRARKFIPQDAFAQFKDTEDWRNENNLSTLYETIDVNEYEQTRRLYPQWTGRRDKRGIPFYVYEIQHVDAKDVAANDKGKDGKHGATKTPRKMLHLFALYENLCRFVLPFCSAIPNRPNAETPISQSSNIVDISKVGFSKFWNLRNHMSDASTLATAHYPETLDRIFVVGAPSFFPTVWSWAKKWFDPITVSKIFILSDKEIFPTLSQFLEPENIPKKYGGKLDWQFGDRPLLEPQLAKVLQWKEPTESKGFKTFPIGPLKWRYDEKGDLVMMAIGSENGKPRKRVIAALHPDTHVARLALSPGRQDSSSRFAFASSSISGPSGGSTLAPSQSRNSANATTEGASVAAATGTMPSANNTTTGSDQQQMEHPTPAVDSTSRAGTYTIPYRDDSTGIASPPADARQGTSATRFEQQAGTHAHDQLAAGTPEVRVDGQGERVGVMEPNTVGQAPKEHPMPHGGEGEEQPGMMEKAQVMAGQAYEQVGKLEASVLSAVGLGGGKAEEKKEEVETPAQRQQREQVAAKVDGMSDKNVEEFLRMKPMTHPQPPGR